MNNIGLRTFQKSNLPYVEYTSNIEPEEERVPEAEKAQIPTTTESTTVSTSTAPQSRAVARKSTSKKQTVVDTSAYNHTSETKPSHSIVVSTSNKATTDLSLSRTGARIYLHFISVLSNAEQDPDKGIHPTQMWPSMRSRYIVYTR